MLVDLATLTKPYVECRREADEKIVALQQQIQTRQREKVNYDVYSDPTYQLLNDIVLRAESDCDLHKYVSLVAGAVTMSGSYNDFQKQKMAEFLIQDIVKLQWTVLNAKSGTYKFPEITVADEVESQRK